FTHPGQAVLVEQFDGNVVFEPALPRDKQPMPQEMEEVLEQLRRMDLQLRESRIELDSVRRDLITTCGPSRLLGVLPDDKKPAAKESKILGRSFWRAAARANVEAQQLVIRSPEELAKAGITTEEQLAKQFKDDKIDWKTQMVVVATGGMKPTGGY